MLTLQTPMASQMKFDLFLMIFACKCLEGKSSLESLGNII